MATNQPDLGIILANWWGGGCDNSLFIGAVATSAANIRIGTNPPYAVTDFLSVYSKFGGTPLTPTAILTAGSPTATVSDNSGLAIGQLIAGAGIPPDTTIAAMAGTDVTLSANATATGQAVPLTVYTLPLVPVIVLQMYIALASGSVQQTRWCGQWMFAMSLYVAHFATLWLQSEGDADGTAGQAASSGLAKGMKVSQAVGDVSVTYQLATTAFESWGAWQQTTYGTQLITLASIAGWGIMQIL